MKNKLKESLFTSFRYDFSASITVFFVALPLCLGVALASGAPVSSGLIAGVVGGLVISVFSASQLSVSGPAAGLTAICAASITAFGDVGHFFASVAAAGILQILLGLFRLGGFTRFIPSAVIRGMLAAIGVILISKQVPLVIGYNQPDFWSNQFINLFTFEHGFKNITNLSEKLAPGAMLISIGLIPVFYFWQKFAVKRISFLPTAFAVVLVGAAMAWLGKFGPWWLALNKDHYVNIPANAFTAIQLPAVNLFLEPTVLKTAFLICFVGSLETLLSIEAIDKLDPLNRITPQNRELVAQGAGNFLSGLLGGLPVTAVIVRSSANAEAGAKTRLSAFLHGLWLLLAVLVAAPLINYIPYCVLAVLLIKTGYNLAKPEMIAGVYKQGKEQFLPFIVTVTAVLFTDLLIGVLIGVAFAVYYLILHTYRAGYTLTEEFKEGKQHYYIDLALNVSFLNKKRMADMLDRLAEDSVVHINGAKSVYIDHDVLEIFHDFKAKAKAKNIRLLMHSIPDVQTIELH